MYCSWTPTAADPPTSLVVEPVRPTSVRVSWTAPLSVGTVTGYQIYYQTVGDWESVSVDAGVTNYTLSNLQDGFTYNITMLALSVHLPSSVVGPQTVTLGKPYVVGLYTYLSLTHGIDTDSWNIRHYPV